MKPASTTDVPNTGFPSPAERAPRHGPARRRLLCAGAGALAALNVSTPTAASTAGDAPLADTERTGGAAFWDAWLELWNGDLDSAGRLVAPDIRVHTTLLDGRPGSALDGVDAFVDWIGQLRAAFDGLAFTTVAGPLVDRPPGAVSSGGGADRVAGLLVAGHWAARGTYAGDVPGATLAPGEPLAFVGTDLVRLDAGRAAEYWLVTDTLALLRQLGLG